MQPLTGLSFAHPAIDADGRGHLSIPGDLLASTHRRLRSAGHQVFLLSTCLRVEMAWEGGPEIAPDLTTAIYGQASLSNLGRMRTDEDLFLHLCRIAGGLESPVIGETEVLSQVRRAVSLFNEGAGAPGDLARALEASIGVGRAIRRSMGRSPGGSLASVAARAAAPSGRVAVLGTGAMAGAAIRHLDGVEVTVFARRPATVAGRSAQPWGMVPEALAAYPAVISTVPGGAPLLGDQVVYQALARRPEPLLLIDLGMPPGFTSLRAQAVRYLGVDDLASLADGRPSAQAEQTATAAAAAAWRRLTSPERAGSIITAILHDADRVVAEEVRRFAHRLPSASDPEGILHQLAHTVARRVLHSPISYVGSSDPASDAIEVLAEAFGIPDE